VVALRPEVERAFLAAERGLAEASVVTRARAVANFAGSASAVGSLVGALPSTARGPAEVVEVDGVVDLVEGEAAAEAVHARQRWPTDDSGQQGVRG
jgi:hypothetical protein